MFTGARIKSEIASNFSILAPFGSGSAGLFDAHEFVVQKGSSTANQHGEGHLTYWRYDLNSGAGTPPSWLQIARNYQNAVQRLGGKKMYDAVPGILFDFGKSELKPQSQAAIQEIAKLLQSNPALKLRVVGPTDAVGSAESNVTLSNARAAAVVQALTQRNGIDSKRLAPFGAGPYAPVAS